VILDANLLLYASDTDSPFHARSLEWLVSQLEGDRRLGIPWPTIVAYVRIVTHPRVMTNPLTPAQAWANIEALLEHDVVWVPQPTSRHAAVLGRLVTSRHLSGNLVADAHLAALAIEHGVAIASADSDFARMPDVRWENPLS
jgi:toxin-antitoxin system PIN domain toxin